MDTVDFLCVDVVLGAPCAAVEVVDCVCVAV